jgi:Tfp pilus assembly protein PilF
MTPADMLKKGQAAFFAKPPDYQQAKVCFERVTLSAPKWVEGYHWLASACEKMADHDQATKAYKQAIQCDPKDSRPRIAMGRLLTSTGHLKEAIIELQKGIELKPHYCEADARLFLAAAYEKANDLSKAKEQWKIVEEMEPSYPSYEKPMREARKKLREHANT